MIEKKFQSIRPVVFITDSKDFNFVDFKYDGIEEEIITSSSTTIAVECADATNDKYARLRIYINEKTNEYLKMHKIFDSQLNLPSNTVEILEGDAEIVFSQNFLSNSISVKIYIDNDYEDAPEDFIILLDGPLN